MFFLYKVIDKDGKETEGRVEATNRTNAISLLLSNGYTVLKLTEDVEDVWNVGLFLRVRTRDLVIFSRQIATLFEAEVSALRALNLVAGNVQNPYFQGILRDITKSIEQGMSLEKAFTKYQHIFGEFFVSIIAVGERSGTLARSFTYLADYVERSADTVTRIRKAMTYPIFVIVMFFIVITLILVTVIPQISSILTQSGAELPLITKIVIGASDFVKGNIVFIALGLLFTVVGLVLYVRTEDGKQSLDSFLISLPLIGRLLREFYLIQFSSNLSVMLGSGVPIVSALEIVGRVITNYEYKKMVVRLGELVRQGVALSTAMENQPFIGKDIPQIIRVGEETGELKKMLDVISHFYDRQMRDTIDTFLDLIQPTIIIILGLSVGLLIGSVIIPIYSISSAL